MRVLVTGADGFVGSHLVERLVKSGADTRAFCFYNSNGSLGWLDDSDVRNEIDVRLGDVRDARFVEEACKGVDVIFHLAALIAIPYSYEAPESFVDTNVKGTLNVLEAAKRVGCQRVVHTSTSEVYGTPDSVPICESHSLKGQSPYSASKIAADKLCEAYFYSYDLPVTVIRPFNTYGPRQSMRAVLPTILCQLLAGKEVKLGSLKPRRDMTYVADTVEAFVLAGEAEGVEGEVIQLGTGDARSIGEIFTVSCGVLGIDGKVVREDARVRPKGSEVQVLLSDPSKAKEYLGWTANVLLEDGLRLTAEWLKANENRFEAGRYYR